MCGIPRSWDFTLRKQHGTIPVMRDTLVTHPPRPHSPEMSSSLFPTSCRVCGLPGDLAVLIAREPRRKPSAGLGRALTPRQRQVLQLISDGKTMKDISMSLNISMKTVEFHRLMIKGKLRLRSSGEVVDYALTQEP